MQRFNPWFGHGVGYLCIVLLIVAVAASALRAEVITLNNGMQLKGALTRVKSLNQDPTKANTGGNVDVRKIVLVDDDLRRTFVSSNNVRADGLASDDDVNLEKIRIRNKEARSSRRIGAVGQILDVTPFDKYGRRIFSMLGHDGRIDVIQGITEITPVYTKVEGLLSRNAYVWDMRISTSSIPRDVLTRILLRYVDQDVPDDRMKVVRLYIQAERYLDALVELDRMLEDFPDLKELQNERTRLYQLVISDVIREIELRRDAGQYRMAHSLLTSFPEKDVAGELLLKVSDMLDEYDKVFAEAKRATTLFAKHTGQLADHRDHEKIVAITEEIKSSLNINNLDRLADYLRLADDDAMAVDQRMSLAISGWLLGSGTGIDNLSEALSLIDVRSAVREYLRSESDIEREEILERLKQMEGSAPANVAKIVATMDPPIDTDFPQDSFPGLLQLSFPGILDDPEFNYFIQLPPEYDPSRRYPCVVTLHGSGSQPMGQIEWWAGPIDAEKQQRVGQATRQGYIVLAPVWARPKQGRYEYSLREHAVVLGALRDACRRFSIDTDRVFLSGHSMGADAAWDISLAHPDLWAGVLPVAAEADRYVTRYWKNAKTLPYYFVAGQLDSNKIASNARDLDRYLTKAGYDAMYVEYRGRGHEHFHDEILRMFDWMGRYRRAGMPREFVVTSMRPWDQFFWWVELADFPDQFMVQPTDWPQSGARDAETDVRITPNNTIYVKTPANEMTLWLSPELVDFSRRISYGRERIDATPSNEVLLWDVLTRGDRQHPFWAKFTPNTGRRSARR